MPGLDITGIGTAIGAVSDILGKFIPDPAVAEKAKSEISTALIQQQDQLFASAAQVAAADDKSESWLTRNARPVTVFWCLFLITWLAIIAPLFGKDVATATTEALAGVPGYLWALLSAGIGAYPLLRSVEKMQGAAGPVAAVVAKVLKR